jgi:hypothetical protein
MVMIPRLVGFWINWAAGDGRLGDAVVKDEIQVDTDEGEDDRRDEKNVESEKRLNVAPPRVLPASMKRAMLGPTSGAREAISAASITDQTAF